MYPAGDWSGFNGKNIARIESGIHAHDGNSGLGFAVKNGTLDGGGTPVARED